MTRELRQANDRVLHPLIEAANEQAAECAIEALIRRARPVFEQVAGYYRRRSMLAGHDVDEIRSTVDERLLIKLRRLRAAPSVEAIASFDGYVAGIAYNAVNDFFRQRYPERARLKKQLREIVRSDPRFTTEGTAAGLLCALAPGAAAEAADASPAGAMAALLESAGAPMLLDDAVTMLLAASAAPSPADDVPDPAETPLARLEQRAELQRLWREIRLLRPHQRAALLLNMRGDDGGNELALFLALGVATADDVAEALAMPVDALAALWNDLPLDDRTIAARLGLTRQQVINLRKSARERLSRRLLRGGE